MAIVEKGGNLQKRDYKAVVGINSKPFHELEVGVILMIHSALYSIKEETLRIHFAFP
jgi:hypothetical protein